MTWTLDPEPWTLSPEPWTLNPGVRGGVSVDVEAGERHPPPPPLWSR